MSLMLKKDAKCLISTKERAGKELIVALMHFETLVGQELRQGDNSELST